MSDPFNIFSSFEIDMNTFKKIFFSFLLHLPFQMKKSVKNTKIM